MGIFGGGKKKLENQPIDIPSDIEDIKRMVNNPTNVRMSQVRMPDDSEQPVWRGGREEWQQPQADRWEPEPQQEPVQPAYAPLFVKIDKYRGILSSLGAIKATISLVRNSFTAMGELDKARQQTMGVINSALEKIERKLDSLDKELVRPTGFNTNISAEDYQDVHNVDSTVADLRGQIQQLKSELQQL